MDDYCWVGFSPLTDDVWKLLFGEPVLQCSHTFECAYPAPEATRKLGCFTFVA